MSEMDRRDALRWGTWGLAAAGLQALTLRADAAPTEASGDATEGGSLAESLRVLEIPAVAPPEKLTPTEVNILGPYFRPGAPYRAKITPPLEPGEVLVIRGRVWSAQTRKPLAGAVLHVWQANATGRYDNDDPKLPPKAGVFANRARIMADETGYYEYQTVKPGRYKIGPDQWRPAHIHYAVEAKGYSTLVTQMYFAGDPMNDKDQFIKPSLIIDPEKIRTRQGEFLLGTFDIVLVQQM